MKINKVEKIMKWPKEQFELLDNGFKLFLQGCGHSIAEIREAYKDIPFQAVYSIYRQIWQDLMYDDNHPRYHNQVLEDGSTYVGKTRLVSYSSRFVLYPPGCNDTHLKTVLKILGKKHGLI